MSKSTKQVISALAAPNEGLTPVIAGALLESTAWVSKYNTETRAEALEYLLAGLPLPKESRPFLNPKMFDGDGVQEVGLVTWEDLRETAGLHQSLTKMLQPDREGRSYSDPEWAGKRRFRRAIQRETPFKPLGDLLRRVQKDDSLRAVLKGLDTSVPYFTYRDHVKMRLKNQKKAMDLFGPKLRGTPVVKFTSFWELKERLNEVSQTIWVNESNIIVSDLLVVVGNLRVEP